VKTACENALAHDPSLATSLPRYIISFICDVDRTLGTILYEDDVDWREIVDRLRSKTGIVVSEWYTGRHDRQGGEEIDAGDDRRYTIVTYQTVPTVEALADDMIVFVMRGDRIVREFTTRSPAV
jgi:hypothetical protein